MLLIAVVAVAAASEGSILFLDMPADASLMPQLEVIDLETLDAGQPLTAEDEQVLAALAAELEAVRPLVDEFDGELGIMARLGDALAAVTVIRDDADRALVYEALVFQGFAVNRYFQDQLADEAAAAPYRRDVLERIAVGPWVDAIALDPERTPPAELLPDAAAVTAFDELRAGLRVAQRSTVSVVDDLRDGAVLVVDGSPVEGSTLRTPPGRHWAMLVDGDGVVLRRAQATLAPGQRLELELGALTRDVMALTDELALAPNAVPVDASVRALLADLAAPVHLAVASDDGALIYVLEGPTLLPVERQPTAPQAGEGGERFFVARVGLAGGWLYDGDYLLLNHSEGATSSRATVNVPLTVATIGAEIRPGPLAVGVGADLGYPFGEFSTLPSGDEVQRLRGYLHAAVGLPVAQLTVGYYTPWQLGVGVRGHVPIGPVELTGAVIAGYGMDIYYSDTAWYEASDVVTAWAGVTLPLGR